MTTDLLMELSKERLVDIVLKQQEIIGRHTSYYIAIRELIAIVKRNLPELQQSIENLSEADQTFYPK